MPEKSLAILPPNGYGETKDNYSKISMAYIYWMEQKLGLSNVRSARKGFEVKLGRYKMDAIGWDKNNKLTALLFDGCYYHGHSCIKKRNTLLDARAELTQRRDEDLAELSTNPNSPFGLFTIHTMKECAFKALMKTDPEAKKTETLYQILQPSAP